MILAFETKRLRVFTARVEPTDHNLFRDIFVAFRTDEDRPMVTATAVISPHTYHFIDWLEVTSEYRRQGFGRELLEGLEKYFDHEFEVTAGSELGELFIAAVCKEAQ